MTTEHRTFVAFAGTSLIARGDLADVGRRGKDRLNRGEDQRIAVFDDETGRPVDVDFSGSEAEVLAKIAAHPMAARSGPESGKRPGPGRPKLGVVSREVSLLPRHWGWLAEQRGGASAALRRLVDTARKENTAQERTRKAIDAAHRFMWDMAGDRPGFEEASRSLFAQDFDTFAQLISEWPIGIREQLERFTRRSRPSEPEEPAGASVE